MKLSPIEENYIKNIYRLQEELKTVNTNALSEALKTSPASVTDMLKKLRSKKLIEYKKYYGFHLNSEGCREALKIVRRHRLWECFLVAKLDMDWQVVHNVAEELEHVSSGELIEKLDKFLGFPQTDPHGDPIPNAKGEMPELNLRSLAELPLKQSATVSAVSNQSDNMLSMLDHYGISLGANIKVLKHFEFDGSMEVKISRNPSFNISRQIAENILVYND